MNEDCRANKHSFVVFKGLCLVWERWTETAIQTSLLPVSSLSTNGTQVRDSPSTQVQLGSQVDAFVENPGKSSTLEHLWETKEKGFQALVATPSEFR